MTITCNPGCNCSACRASGRRALPLAMPRRGASQRALAERQWSAPTRARVAQRACDHGLFSDESSQLDLVEMFADPTND